MHEEWQHYCSQVHICVRHGPLGRLLCRSLRCTC